MNLEDYFRSNTSELKYNVDIVFVVDATGSMDNLIETIKSLIPKFYQEVKVALDNKNKSVDKLRAKVIFFRDFAEYMVDSASPLMQTDFHDMADTEQVQALSNQIASIEAIGGGDIPEDGLEGLACAMRSDWCPKEAGHKRRHIIVLFTDAPTHDIGYGRTRCNVYPDGMPNDFEELTRWWGNANNSAISMNHNAKRLILFTPPVQSLPKKDGYRRIIEGKMPWENCDVIEINPEEHLIEVDFYRILDRIVNSI